MKNDLTALNNYLFEAIERINDDSLSEEELNIEIKKSKAIKDVAETIIDNARLGLQAQKHFDDIGDSRLVEIPMLGLTDK
ncbi:MAG: hypothetical protein Q4D26_10290 [Clostridia bacterium]|nr:hypothetical protein [Clostridia bacterium]